jgi:hypothetical protein
MQGLGITTYLLSQLEAIAKENGFVGFTATVLRENSAMLHLFKKRYPNAVSKSQGGAEILVTMDFNR